MSELASHFSHEFHTSIITLVDSEPFYDLAPSVKLFSPGKRLSRLKSLRTLQQVWHVLKSLRRIRPHICMIFGEDIAGILCPLARLAGSRRVFVSNRGAPCRSQRGIAGRLNPYAYRLAECVIVQTTEAAKALDSAYRKCRFQVIGNPVSIPSRVSSILTRRKQVICVASMGREKNQIGLIRIFSGLSNPKDWKLVLVGDGPNRQNLERLRDQMGLKGRIEFLGQRTDVSSLLQESQIFAFPSLSEGFPNALAEALAAGCACISYDCSAGPAEIIINGVSGSLVPVGNERLFSEKLQALIDDETVRVTYSEQARSFIRRFDSPVILAKFRQLITSV